MIIFPILFTMARFEPLTPPHVTRTQGRSVLLGDEMGLGKTAQASSMLRCLAEIHSMPGPFLVIAPLSTLPHWRSEIEVWTRLHAITFHGNREAREAIVRYEWASPPRGHLSGIDDGSRTKPSMPLPPPYGKYGAPLDWCEEPKFDVCVTSYEMFAACSDLFAR